MFSKISSAYLLPELSNRFEMRAQARQTKHALSKTHSGLRELEGATDPAQRSRKSSNGDSFIIVDGKYAFLVEINKYLNLEAFTTGLQEHLTK